MALAVDGDKVKSGEGAAVTVTGTDAVALLTPDPVAVTVMFPVVVAAAVPAMTADRVLVVVEPLSVDGVRVTVTPDGAPDADRVTAPV